MSARIRRPKQASSRCWIVLGVVSVVAMLAQPASAGHVAASADSAQGVTQIGRMVLRDALIIDGLDNEPFLGEVLIEAGRIASVGGPGSVVYAPGLEVVNLAGRALAPGFIDMHNHSTDAILSRPQAEALVSQGVTTIVVGADGGSPWPIGDYLRRVERALPAVNVAVMVGHGTVRRAILGDNFHRAATVPEAASMRQRVAQGMEEGAFGLSTGLEYDPGFYASTDEIIELARAAADYGGFYMTHMRDEEEGVMGALGEAIRVGIDAELPVQVSHIKMGNASVWGQADEALERIRRARDDGLDITADQYPYPAWSSSLSIVVSSRRFNDPEAVAEGLAALGGPERLQITRYAPDPSIEGLRLDEIARRKGVTPVDMYMQMMAAGGASVIGHTMSQEDIDTFARSPLVMVASDGGIGSSHPRGAGTFPRVLGRWVRERGLMPLERAVYKMTSLPARRLGLEDRGRIAAGAVADLVVFDPETVIDNSTFEEPGLLSDGIEKVWVGGVLVWDDGRATGAHPGQALRRR